MREQYEQAQTQLAIKAAMAARGSFGGVAFSQGVLRYQGHEYAMADCWLSIQPGTDPCKHGWSTARETSCSGGKTARGYLHVETPDGERVIAFRASQAAAAEQLVTKFAEAVRSLRRQV